MRIHIIKSIGLLTFLVLFSQIFLIYCASTKKEIKQVKKTEKTVKKAEKPDSILKLTEKKDTTVKKEEVSDTAASQNKQQDTVKADIEKPDTTLIEAEKPAQKERISEIRVAKAAICTAVVDREPQGGSDTFGKGIKKLYCFSHIKGVKDTLEIKHKWYLKDKLMGTIPLSVKAVNWRTYSSKKISENWSGDCKVEIVNSENGDILKSLNFSIN